MILLTYFISFLLSFVSSELCCQGQCTIQGEEKYYSIDTRHNMCGECCMKPEDYDLYKKFEKGLTAANGTVNPCYELNYPTYVQTETHGFGTVTMTLDMYSPAKK
mmetsp:Transcript_1035/g.1038  ORF Transcript_1035/g.1038 Transcript_1035/m.1038 type:complete len:105 (-) Transcript_1035:188-502(-)